MSSSRITPIDHTSYDSGRCAEYAVYRFSAKKIRPGHGIAAETIQNGSKRNKMYRKRGA